MDPSKEHIPRLQHLLREINHRYTNPPPPSLELRQLHHHWIHDVLGPLTSWSTAKLDVAENTSVTIIERAYPFVNNEMGSVFAQLTAIVTYLDDSLENETLYDDIGGFAHRVYMGEAQPNGVLALYQKSLQELSKIHEGDAVLRGMAVMPWIAFLDACMMEKRLLTVDDEVGASPYDLGYKQRADGQRHVGFQMTKETPVAAELNFPIWLRHKSGIGESYAANVFKASAKQELPLSRFVKAMPDIIFFIEIFNDLLSFYKEQLDGETTNLIHLQNRAWKAMDSNGKWSLLETFGRLCDEVRDATFRVDNILRLEDCERVERGEVGKEEVNLLPDDVTMAMQWRQFRDGYISWYLEDPRYKLEFMRPEPVE